MALMAVDHDALEEAEEECLKRINAYEPQPGMSSLRIYSGLRGRVVMVTSPAPLRSNPNRDQINFTCEKKLFS